MYKSFLVALVRTTLKSHVINILSEAVRKVFRRLPVATDNFISVQILNQYNDILPLLYTACRIGHIINCKNQKV